MRQISLMRLALNHVTTAAAKICTFTIAPAVEWHCATVFYSVAFAI